MDISIKFQKARKHLQDIFKHFGIDCDKNEIAPMKMLLEKRWAKDNFDLYSVHSILNSNDHQLKIGRCSEGVERDGIWLLCVIDDRDKDVYWVLLSEKMREK